ncbi:MAG: FAD/NAD(P)-binding protein [Pseudomonadota bacterium]
MQVMPQEARVVTRVEESRDIFTLGLQFTDSAVNDAYRFAPGQFNMLYLHGVGEVPISIVSDPEDSHILHHTIRSVGRVTDGLARLAIGDHLGVRGPYGRGWPVEQAVGRTLFVVTGGLGCAPVVSVINYVLKRRAQFGRLIVMQGVKHADDLIWRDQYDVWKQLDDVEVYLAADVADPRWNGTEGPVTVLFGQTGIPSDSIAFLCGPEPMMAASARALEDRGVTPGDIYLSLERNMQCATGHCGHCQLGGQFVCGDGPVFAWPRIRDLLRVRYL